MSDLRLHVRFEDGGDGWITAQIVEIPQAISQGRTRDEARANALEALRELTAVHDDLRDSEVDVESFDLVAA